VVFLLVAAAVVAGWWSMKGLPLDATPDEYGRAYFRTSTPRARRVFRDDRLY
jgi:hypothetical protein